jgi:hypothetical protein
MWKRRTAARREKAMAEQRAAKTDVAEDLAEV